MMREETRRIVCDYYQARYVRGLVMVWLVFAAMALWIAANWDILWE